MCVGTSCIPAHRRQRQADVVYLVPGQLELHTETPSQVGAEETTKGGWRAGSAFKGEALNHSSSKGKLATPVLAGPSFTVACES